ncbi:hypothetical protein Tco_1174389 [Tanacetum coccineum]
MNCGEVHSGGAKLNRRSNAGVGEKKQVSGFNMGSKFQFKSIKQVFKPVSKKNDATTSSMKNNTKTPSREASCSNPFDAFRSVENDDVLGTNGGSSMRAGTAGDEDNDNEVEEVFNKTTCFMAFKSGGGIGSKSIYERWKDDYDYNPYDDDDCEDLTDEQLAICDSF